MKINEKHVYTAAGIIIGTVVGEFASYAIKKAKKKINSKRIEA